MTGTSCREAQEHNKTDLVGNITVSLFRSGANGYRRANKLEGEWTVSLAELVGRKYDKKR